MPNPGFLGWAYVTGSAIVVDDGQSEMLPFYTESRRISGSNNLTFDYTNNNLFLTGNLNLSGAINAYEFNSIVVNDTTHAGTTKFGNDTDDTHQFTGSILNAGLVSSMGFANAATINITASVPANYNAVLYGPITIGADGAFTISADANIKIKDIGDV
jgi:hypothetical protein